MIKTLVFVLGLISLNDACSYLRSQPSVISETKKHALYLWMYIDSGANVTEVARVAANIQAHVNYVSPPELVTPATEVIAGVGFGESFYAKISKTSKNFTYVERIGLFGSMPATGGDIFIHAKSDSTSKLFELAQQVLRQMPPKSVSNFTDIYGFVYKNGRDLSGFIDGTKNPVTPENRQRVAIQKTTGASFLLTQQWVHNMTAIAASSSEYLESVIGRNITNSDELQNKGLSSHVARMRGTSDYQTTPPFEIVRQSQPYGSLSAQAGLFFIAYSSSTDNFNFMLDNMMGKGNDKRNDMVLLITKPVTGNFWYVPGAEEIKQFF